MDKEKPRFPHVCCFKPTNTSRPFENDLDANLQAFMGTLLKRNIERLPITNFPQLTVSVYILCSDKQRLHCLNYVSRSPSWLCRKLLNCTVKNKRSSELTLWCAFAGIYQYTGSWTFSRDSNMKRIWNES